MITASRITPHYAHKGERLGCFAEIKHRCHPCTHIYLMKCRFLRTALAQTQPRCGYQKEKSANDWAQLKAVTAQTNVIMHQTTRGGGTTCFYSQ